MAQILDLGKIRFQYRGAYNSGTQYEFNDCVKFGGALYAYTSSSKSTGTSPTNTNFWTSMLPGFAFQSNWDSGTQYAPGNVVRYGGNLYYYSAATESTGVVPTNTSYWTVLMTGWNFAGAWDGSTAFKLGQLVTYGGVLYVAVIDSTGQNPEGNTTYWSTVVQGIQYEGAYNSGTTYQKNDVVTYLGTTYIALATNTGVATSNTSYWSILASGVVSTLPLQIAGTVDLSSSDQTLTTSVDATTFSSLIRITAAREFASLILPNATSAPLSQTKYRVNNETQWSVAVRDNTGQLLIAVQPFGFLDIVLIANGSQAGTWHVEGRDLSPVFVRNSVIVPNANATAGNNNPTTNPVFDTRLDSNKVLSAHVAGSTINAFVTDYSTVPATVSTTPLVFTPGNTTLVAAFTISATRAILFTLTDAYLVGISGTTVTQIGAGIAAGWTSFVRTGVMGVIGVQQMDTDLFAVMFGGAANAQPSAYAVKYDADVLRISTALNAGFSSNNGVLNGWDFAVTSTSTFVHVCAGYSFAASAGTAPFDLAATRITVTKNASGAVPTLAVTSTLQVEAATYYYSGSAYSIIIQPDSTNKNNCVVVADASGTTGGPRAVALTNCVSGTLTAGASVSIDANVPTNFTASNTFGQTFTRRMLRSVTANNYHFIYQSLNNYLRTIKLVVSTNTTIAAKVSNYVPKAAAANIQSFLPTFTNATESMFAVYHGQVGQSYSGIVGYTEDANGLVNFKAFNAPVGDHLSQTQGSSVLCTSDGWVLIQVAQPSAATTASVLNSVYACFRCYAAGQVKYFGQVALPFNSGVGALWNPQFLEAGRIVHAHVGNEYDFTLNIPYRRATYVEFAKN